MKISPELARENLIVLSLVQALLGLVTPDLLGASVVVGGRAATLHFWVREESLKMTEVIEDIEFDFWAALDPSDDITEVNVQIHAGWPPLGLPHGSWVGRMTFWAKPPDVSESAEQV